MFAGSGGGDAERKASLDASMYALELKLQQLCVYASLRRLCIAAAVATAFQEVEEGLLMLARPKTKSIAAEIAPATKVHWLLHGALLSLRTLIILLDS